MKYNVRTVLILVALTLAMACGGDASEQGPLTDTSSSDGDTVESQACEDGASECPSSDTDAPSHNNSADSEGTASEIQSTTSCTLDESCPTTDVDPTECMTEDGCTSAGTCEDDDCGTSAGTCAVPDDCLDGETCSDGECIPATDLDCGPDMPCPDGEACELGRCVPRSSGPCLDDDQCPDALRCVSGECVPGLDGDCEAADDCAEEEACLEGRCAPVPTPPCAVAEDCETGQVCIEEVCVDRGTCGTSDDCGQDEDCDEGQCVPVDDTGCDMDEDCSANPASHVRFVPFVPEGLEDHRFRFNPGDPLGFGSGFAFFDFEGNGLPDLFTGGDPGALERACVWRNTSSPGQPRFEPVEDLCDGSLTGFLGAFGIDIDGDGRDELILLGDGRAALLRFHPDPHLINLVHPRLDPDAAERCEAASAAWLDLDLDGAPELVIGCILPGIAQLDTAYDLTNLLFGFTHEQLPEPIDIPEAALLLRNDSMRSPGSTQLVDGPGGTTLGLGIVDLNGNGLPDVIVVNDSFSTPHERFPSFERGHALLRCPPDEDCTWNESLFSEGATAWGAFMGVGNVRIESEDWTYITDWGANHLVRMSDVGLLAYEAHERGVALEEKLGRLQISWSALVDDFTGSGLDDVLVTQGVLPNAQAEDLAAQPHTLLAQVEGGRFAALDEEVGFVAPEVSNDFGQEVVRNAGRGAVRLDVDGSGQLHIVVAVLDGPLQFYRLEHVDGPAQPRRCTLDPVNSVVPSRAWGYAISDASGTDFRTRDIQGQMRASPPRTLLTEHTEGILRFPSGWEEAFTCTPGEGTITIAEPDWINVSRQGDSLRIQLQRPGHLASPSSLEVLVRDEAGAVTRHQAQAGTTPGEWTVNAPEAGDAMLVLDGFHVARWWPVPRD